MASSGNIESKISRLSPKLLRELDKYLDYLLRKKTKGAGVKLSQKWAGGLKEVKDSSVSLQKKSLDWRNE